MHSECTCGRLPHASGCPFFAATEQVFLGNRFTPCPDCAEKDKELERVIAEREWAMNATDDEQLTAATKRIEELERALDRLAQGNPLFNETLCRTEAGP